MFFIRHGSRFFKVHICRGQHTAPSVNPSSIINQKEQQGENQNNSYEQSSNGDVGCNSQNSNSVDFAIKEVLNQNISVKLMMMKICGHLKQHKLLKSSLLR